MTALNFFREILPRLVLHPLMALALSLVGILLLHQLENQVYSLPFTMAVLALIWMLFFVATNRPITSLYLGWLVMAVSAITSFTKYQHRGFSLHVYDFGFFGRDAAMMEFLIAEFSYLLLPVAIIAATASLSIVIMLRIEQRSRLMIMRRAMGLLATIIFLPLTFPAEAQNQRYFYYLGGRHASALFVSFVDLGHVFAGHDLEERLRTVEGYDPFADEVECRLDAGQPDVFLVIAESQVPPRHFPQLDLDPALEETFLSGDGAFHPLQVETYGGGTWISNMALLAGLSGADFGWRAPYLTVTLQDRIRGAIPELFRRCGYRTVTLYPMEESFVNEGPFLKSIGFEEVIDMDGMGADHWIMRDKFYYDYAEAFLEEHRQNDGRPLFMEIMTMFAHAPYDPPMEPDIVVSGQPLHSDPELAEYLRRLWIARDDFHAFLGSRAEDPGEQGAVVLEFGDHHSFATRELSDEAHGGNSLADLESSAYSTFFTLHGFGHAVDQGPPAERLDIAYLGAHLLEAARLPTSPTFQDLNRLRELCDGRFYSCQHREEIDIHLRRRMDGGLLNLSGPGS